MPNNPDATKRWRENHPEQNKEIQRLNNLKRSESSKQVQREWMEWARNKKGNRCFHCKKPYEPGKNKFIFHHVDRQFKVSEVGRLAYCAFSKSTVKRFKDEVNKCMLLCAQCHKRHHEGTITLDVERWRRMQWPVFIWFFDEDVA